MKTVHVNGHLKNFTALLTVENPDEKLVAMIGLTGFMKKVPSAVSPDFALHNGEKVVPHFEETGKVVDGIVGYRPTDQPEVFTIGGLQKNYRGETCFRVYRKGDTFGCVCRPSEFVQP